MNNIENKRSLNPEGLTSMQEKLARLLFDTKIVAPVGGRRRLSDGTYELYKTERPTSPIDFSQSDEEFALKHHEENPEAPLSPIYINLRNLPPAVLAVVGKVMAEIVSYKQPQLCAGIPKAGVPLAKAYSKFSGVPNVEIMNKEEDGFERKIIVGEPAGPKRAVRVIDDLITKGKTKLEALKALEKMGYVVTDLFVLVDRSDGAVGELREAGYSLRSVFTIDQLLRYGLRTGRISPNRYREARSYRDH